MLLRQSILFCIALLLSCSEGRKKFTSTTSPIISEGTLSISEESNITLEAPIDSFGSVILDGIRFDTDSTLFTVDAQISNDFSVSNLQVGMVVQLEGYLDEDGTARANKIHFNDKICGLIQLFDSINNFIEIAGQTIIFDDETLFYNIDEEALAIEFSIDTPICVSGFLDNSGSILASRIHKKDYIGNYKIEGVVTEISQKNKYFYINDLQVNFDKAKLIDIKKLQEGDQVLVRASINDLQDAELTAREILISPSSILSAQKPPNHQRVLQGLISSDVDTSVLEAIGMVTFNLRGMKVMAFNDSTEYQQGYSYLDLAKGQRVTVNGLINRAATVRAKRISFHPKIDSIIEGLLTSIDQEQRELTVGENAYLYNARTKIFDKSSAKKKSLLQSLSLGDRVKIYSYIGTSGASVIAKLERKENDTSDFNLKGRIKSVSGTTFEIEGYPRLTINGNTAFYDESSKQIPYAEFTGIAREGTWVHLAVFSAKEQDDLLLKWVRIYPQPLPPHTIPKISVQNISNSATKQTRFNLKGHFTKLKKERVEGITETAFLTVGDKEMTLLEAVSFTHVDYDDAGFAIEKSIAFADFLGSVASDDLASLYGLPIEVSGYIEGKSYFIEQMILYADKQIISMVAADKPLKRQPIKRLQQDENDVDLLAHWKIDQARITFDKKGHYHGFDGCNRFWGKFHAKAGKFKANQPAITKKQCLDNDNDLIELYLKVKRYNINDDELILSDSDNVELLRFALTELANKPYTDLETFNTSDIQESNSDNKPTSSKDIRISQLIRPIKPSYLYEGRWLFNENAYLDLTPSGLNGFDGCNQISGQFRVGLGQISFAVKIEGDNTCSEAELILSDEVHATLQLTQYYNLSSQSVVFLDKQKKQLAKLTLQK